MGVPNDAQNLRWRAMLLKWNAHDAQWDYKFSQTLRLAFHKLQFHEIHSI